MIKVDNRKRRDEEKTVDATQTDSKKSEEKIPEAIIEEARELGRGAEILPDGYMGLARKLYEVKKAGRKLRVKLGVDPTSTDLHLGHSVVFRKLRLFQDFGHQIVLIIGGFTAQIGDPSGRNATRPQLTSEQVKENARTYLDQMGLILDIEKTETRNNEEWLAPMNLNDILKLAGKVTVQQLLAKEAFGERMENQQPISFHELFYPILQGYDSVAIEADVELGGTDQRFNILQGRELQPHYNLDQQVAFLLPLIEGTDGAKKMSKTYDNFIGLSEPPSDMFGKCMRIPDELIVKYFELTTTLSGAEVDEIKDFLQSGGNPKEAKARLAKQIVLQYHGEDAARDALTEWDTIHSKRQIPDDMPEYKLTEEKQLFRLLVDTELASGSGQAKRLIADGGVRIDGDQVKDPNQSISPGQGDSIVLQVGRRRFIRINL